MIAFFLPYYHVESDVYEVFHMRDESGVLQDEIVTGNLLGSYSGNFNGIQIALNTPFSRNEMIEDELMTSGRLTELFFLSPLWLMLIVPIVLLIFRARELTLLSYLLMLSGFSFGVFATVVGFADYKESTETVFGCYETARLFTTQYWDVWDVEGMFNIAVATAKPAFGYYTAIVFGIGGIVFAAFSALQSFRAKNFGAGRTW
jgi:hypothetical protein